MVGELNVGKDIGCPTLLRLVRFISAFVCALLKNRTILAGYFSHSVCYARSALHYSFLTNLKQRASLSTVLAFLFQSQSARSESTLAYSFTLAAK